MLHTAPSNGNSVPMVPLSAVPFMPLVPILVPILGVAIFTSELCHRGKQTTFEMQRGGCSQQVRENRDIGCDSGERIHRGTHSKRVVVGFGSGCLADCQPSGFSNAHTLGKAPHYSRFQVFLA